MATEKDLEKWFPNIIGKSYRVSISTWDFNCVAFTLGIYNDYIWNTEKSWPKNVSRKLKVENFKKMYESYGFVECYDSSYEEECEKIAFYARNSKEPIHAAIQNKNIWNSKISNLIVEHQLDWLCGDSQDAYGNVVFIMKRCI